MRNRNWWDNRWDWPYSPKTAGLLNLLKRIEAAFRRRSVHRAQAGRRLLRDPAARREVAGPLSAHRARMGTILGRIGAAHQGAHRYLPTCLHTQEQPKNGCR